MKIRVNRTFGRRRLMDSNKIHPGEYDVDDPALFGLAEELVQDGYAEIVGEYSVGVDFANPKAETLTPPKDKNALMADLDALGITYKKSWGVARLQALYDEGYQAWHQSWVDSQRDESNDAVLDDSLIPSPVVTTKTVKATVGTISRLGSNPESMVDLTDDDPDDL